MNVSVIITAIDETWSLQQTVDILVQENSAAISEIILAIAEKTTADCRAVITTLEQQYPSLIQVHQQTLPFIGGALQECVLRVQGAYTILMASDLETDPHAVAQLIDAQHAAQADIVATSRWLQEGSFGNYSLLKQVCNFLFQHFFRTLYRTTLTDLTYGFRLYRTEILQSISWQELKHAFFLETLLIPLVQGYNIHEIPVVWHKRQEGKSHIAWRDFADYFLVGWRIYRHRKQLQASKQSIQKS